MAQFDPYAATPDYAGEGGQAVEAWRRANNKLNLQKNNTLANYGFKVGAGDLGGDVTYNPDGTVKNVTETGGMTGVKDFSEMAGLDNMSGQGDFRDELGSEYNMLQNADNTPDRGFSGGLANQAGDLARQAVISRQNKFTTGYNQFASGFNNAGTDNAGGTNQTLFGITEAQNVQGQNEANWQATQPVAPSPPTGVSGGGSTPINPSSSPAFIQAHGTAGTVYNNPQAPVAKPPKPDKLIPQGAYHRTGSEV